MFNHATRIRIGLLLLVSALMSLLLVACAQSSGSASASGSSAAAQSSASAQASVSGSSSAVQTAADVVTIGLDYNAGTGFEWECDMAPEGVVSLVGQETEDKAAGEAISGGPLREVYTLRAEKPGEVVVTFNLVRSWEGEPAETQIYAFTVTDDLKIVLNPYKSDFENEPEW